MGHVSMASPYDTELSAIIVKAVEREGVLQGEGIKLHDKGTVICIGTLILIKRYISCFTLGGF